jgi:hypothetical protein
MLPRYTEPQTSNLSSMYQLYTYQSVLNRRERRDVKQYKQHYKASEQQYKGCRTI